MSEKRKPSKTIVASKYGKRVRLEMFDASKWGGHYRKYRVRINGKWVTTKRYWTLTEVTSQLRKWLV